MITVDISAAVHNRAGLGRYSARLAQALIAEQPDRFGLFYNQGKNGRFAPHNITKTKLRRTLTSQVSPLFTFRAIVKDTEAILAAICIGANF